jgi:EAL domain-containing protein (putative c-di-GMP-specific phosphodiesterase class I)
VEATTGRIIGAEALARWTHDGKPITPDVFIPAAEDNGLIVPLGELVLDLVADDAPALTRAAGAPISIAVNVSAQQLRDPGFVRVVTDARERMGQCTLILEITERRGIDPDPDCLATMQQLSEAGVVFAIDDFGIGYSAITYLKDTPISIMKTDASLSAEIDTDERACRLLASVTLMGKALGVDVVVEGIERADQLDHLRNHVDPLYAQGFLLHRPMGLEQVVRALTDQRSPAVEGDLTTAS